MLHASTLAATVVERALHGQAAAAGPAPRAPLRSVVPGYPSADAKRGVIRNVREQAASMWPGLEVKIVLRDDSTVDDVVRQLAQDITEWFGD